MFAPHLDLSDEFVADIEELAKRYGFETVEGYLKIVIESHVMAAKIGAQILEEDGVDIRKDLEQGFYEMFTGQYHTEEEFWALMAADDEDGEDE